MSKNSVYYKKNFLNKEELDLLLRSVIEDNNSFRAKNVLELRGIEDIHTKIHQFFIENLGIEVDFLNSFIFFACETTMNSRIDSNSTGWHTDGTCSIVDGDCYNIWLPIYNDSSHTGIEVIPEEDNKELYAQLGDPTEVPMIYAKETSPEIFGFFSGKIPSDTDLVIVKVASGLILPITKSKLKILRFENSQPGDVVIFKQSDLHRGFHSDGIRIQLSLKFRNKNSKINQKSTNEFYKLFESINSGDQTFDNYQKFLEFILPTGQLSKHGVLEKQATSSLLKANLQG